MDRGLRRGGGEQVDGELRDRREQQERCEERKQAEGQEEPCEVAEPAAGHGGRDELPGLRDGGVHDPSRRAADLAVAGEEARAAGPIEVRHDNLDRNQRDGGAGDQDREAFHAPSPRKRPPEAEPRHHETDLLLRRRRDQAAERKRDQASLVEEPDREEQQGAGERDQ